MTTLIERCKCGHDRASHYKGSEPPPPGDTRGGFSSKVLLPFYGACLASFCDCDEYRKDAASP